MAHPLIWLALPTGLRNLADGSGNSVDLDGSEGSGFTPAGEIESVMSLATGSYEVSFDLAGNLRGAPNQAVAVKIGSDPPPPSTSRLRPTPNPTHMYTLIFNDDLEQLSFTGLGPADQQGDLLDNIDVTAAPLPSAWTMMFIGFAGLGYFAYRGSKKASDSIVAA